MGTEMWKSSWRDSWVKEELIWGIVNANSSLHAGKLYLIQRAKDLKKERYDDVTMTSRYHLTSVYSSSTIVKFPNRR